MVENLYEWSIGAKSPYKLKPYYGLFLPSLLARSLDRTHICVYMFRSTKIPSYHIYISDVIPVSRCNLFLGTPRVYIYHTLEYTLPSFITFVFRPNTLSVTEGTGVNLPGGY